MLFQLSKWGSTLAVIGLLAGCGGNNSTGSSSSATVPDHSGANTPITSSNAQQILLETSLSLDGAFGRVLSAAASKQAVPVAAKSIANQTINGQASGTITIKSGQFNATSNEQTLNAELVFDDFSDDGQIYIGGPLSMNLNSSYDNSTGTVSLSFTEKGDLAFSGKYKGTVSLDISVNAGSSGTPTVTGSVTVDGNKVTF